MKFKIKYIQFKNIPKPNIQACFLFSDSQTKYDILEELLNDSFVSAIPEDNHVLQSLNEIASGKQESLISGTERVMMHIAKNETLLTDNFDGVYDNIDILQPLKVSTSDLRDLIIWWIQEKPRLEKIANDSGLSADELNDTSDNTDS
ncbi:hypothetical protein UAY_02988 [Enterococcus moraviensis ATCC BAA-383]|uniref:Uncharacterized protein n=1 Tax=Enterococcus moraviensis ATCC BAA-383 TaxID=1158609 RepID=R2SN76_9ENTE|nr:hypothetical protein [Enterococcus moraviensis]EOH96620.1 hypothetical protein UAY_02988 [Enterococcus moraviensis ATCC BAA-383]EOT66046.1 hypothetical protein I586_02315 [Enterococcus moraviensis ATCC BAA-383]OJG68184.1 hypothetical protein RV09_GL001431 [Enterococcus moraviensis]